MFKYLKAAGACVALLAAGVGTAQAAEDFPNFMVNEGAVIGAPTAIMADKLTGPYVEKFIVTGLNTMTGTGTFLSVAYFDLTSLSRNEGNTAISGIGLNNTYGLFGVFTAQGTFSGVGSGGAVTFSGTNAALRLWADTGLVAQPGGGTGRDTSVTLNNDGTFTLGGNTSNDTLLASTNSFSSGEGRINAGGTAKGDFAIVFSNLLLSTAGKNYFFDPNPFYVFARASGQLDNVNLTSGAITDLSGSVDIRFAVPEPTSLALVGLAMLGLALSRKRVS